MISASYKLSAMTWSYDHIYIAPVVKKRIKLQLCKSVLRSQMWHGSTKICFTLSIDSKYCKYPKNVLLHSHAKKSLQALHTKIGITDTAEDKPWLLGKVYRDKNTDNVIKTRSMHRIISFIRRLFIEL